MGADNLQIHLDNVAQSDSLIMYDVDGVALHGKFDNELAAYRARTEWEDVLKNYFLLEQERDYQLEIAGSLERHLFVLTCNFCSACGRYAFWRLIHHQAPEAEQDLLSSAVPKHQKADKQTAAKLWWSGEEGPSIISTENKETDNSVIAHILKSIKNITNRV